METIDLIKKHGETFDRKYYFVPGGQQCKLPDIMADTETIYPSIYIELEGKSFFVVENPGNINGSCFDIYYHKFDNASIAMRRKVGSMIINNQDVIKIRFIKANMGII